MTLNENLEFDCIDSAVQSAFLSDSMTKHLFRAGHELFAFRLPNQRHSNSISAWWSSVQPLCREDAGLELTLARAGRAAARYSRGRGRRGSSEMLFVGELTVDVYGFYGTISPQRLSGFPPAIRPFFLGGAVQAWIPDLGPSLIRELQLI